MHTRERVQFCKIRVRTFHSGEIGLAGNRLNCSDLRITTRESQHPTVFIQRRKKTHNSWREKEREREFYFYPSSFDEALSNTVEKGMAEVEETSFVEASKLVQQSSSLQIAVAVHHLILYYICLKDDLKHVLKFLILNVYAMYR